MRCSRDTEENFSTLEVLHLVKLKAKVLSDTVSSKEAKSAGVFAAMEGLLGVLLVFSLVNGDGDAVAHHEVLVGRVIFPPHSMRSFELHLSGGFFVLSLRTDVEVLLKTRDQVVLL